MKKQKRITALIASLAMTLTAAAGLGTATAAWFTRGTEAAASGFDFTASAASGIQISTDAATWQSSIVTGDFDLTPGEPQENSVLTLAAMEPVSTVDVLNGSGEYDFFSATYAADDYTLAADTSNYLVFDLYFLNQGADALTLSLTTSATVTDGVTDMSTSLGTRVGFVVEGSHNLPATVIAMTGGVSSYIWEPNSLERTGTAQANGATDSAKYYYNGIDGDNGSTPITAAGVDDYKVLSANGAYTALVNSTKDPAIGDTPVIGTLPGSVGGQITKMKVFVWLEGQDVDTQNDVSAGDVNIDLAFDSGAAVGTLTDRTATAIATPVATTQVTLDQVGSTGATYDIHILETINDTNVSLDYRLYYSTGSDAFDTSPIDLTTAVGAGTYDVVVTGTLTGFIGSRTSASLTHA
jgi:hypothetical protein